MYHVALLVSSPTPGEEAVPTADNFCIKISRELRPVIGESPDTEISTKEGRREVDVHYGDSYIVAVAPALLSALEGCARIETMVTLRAHTDARNVDVGVWSWRMLQRGDIGSY
jgi:hypothetical protein